MSLLALPLASPWLPAVATMQRAWLCKLFLPMISNVHKDDQKVGAYTWLLHPSNDTLQTTRWLHNGAQFPSLHVQ